MGRKTEYYFFRFSLAVPILFRIFVAAMPDECSCRGAMIRGQALHNGKASHDALSIGWLKLPQSIASQRQCGVDVTGMLNTYPVVCVRANYAFNAHLRVYQQYDRGYHSVRQLARAVVGLRKQMGRRWIPTFFVV